jgi:hypothetical protein
MFLWVKRGDQLIAGRANIRERGTYTPEFCFRSRQPQRPRAERLSLRAREATFFAARRGWCFDERNSKGRVGVELPRIRLRAEYAYP